MIVLDTNVVSELMKPVSADTIARMPNGIGREFSAFQHLAASIRRCFIEFGSPTFSCQASLTIVRRRMPIAWVFLFSS